MQSNSCMTEKLWRSLGTRLPLGSPWLVLLELKFIFLSVPGGRRKLGEVRSLYVGGTSIG